MCADVPSMNPAWEPTNPGRRGRDRSGRHRLGSGTIRVVEDGAGRWSLAPVKRPTHYVGRVGVLAVFLGVGGVIVGLPGTASADAGGAAGSDSTVSAGSSGQSGESAGTRRSRAANRAGAASGSPGADSGAASRTARAANRPVSPEIPPSLDSPASRRGVATPSAPTTADRGPETSPPVGTSSPVDAPGDVAVVTGHDEPSVSVPAEELSQAVESAGTAAGPAAAVEYSATAVRAPNEAPVMTAAASEGQLSQAGTGALDWVGGGADPQAPVAAALAWAALAATRRELSGGLPTAAPAASETSGEPLDPGAAAPRAARR